MVRVTALKARFIVAALLVFAFFSFLLLGPYEVTPGHLSRTEQREQQQNQPSGALLTGHAIAPKLGNATKKYVLQDLHARLRSAQLLKHESLADSRIITGQNSAARRGHFSTRRLLAFPKSLR